jgi:Helix-turn-helix domain
VTGSDPGGAWNTGRVIDEYAVWRPVEELRPYVAWCTGYRQAGVEPTTHRGLPSPWLTMIVTLDEPLVIARHPDPRQPASTHDFLLGGLHTAPALVTHDGWQSGIQLALTPPGARALLGMPAAELASIDVEAADVLGRLVIRFDLARRRLLRRQAEGDRVVLAEFATECGYYDQAHLARDFRDLAGCPPSVLLAEEFRNVQAGLQGDWE